MKKLVLVILLLGSPLFAKAEEKSSSNPVRCAKVIAANFSVNDFNEALKLCKSYSDEEVNCAITLEFSSLRQLPSYPSSNLDDSRERRNRLFPVPPIPKLQTFPLQIYVGVGLEKSLEICREYTPEQISYAVSLRDNALAYRFNGIFEDALQICKNN